MALDPLSIAHLGFAYKPLVAAMLGLWDEIVAAIVEMHRYGGGGGRASLQRQNNDNYLVYREHWDYLDELRLARMRAVGDAGGARGIVAQAAVVPPEVSAGRAMRGTVPVKAVPAATGILDDPLALSLLALLIDEATDG